MFIAIRHLLMLALLAPALAAAGEPDVAHTSSEWQIWAYSTAAPSFIGERATVLDQNNDVLRQGSNGFGPVCRGMPARCLKPAGPMPTKPCRSVPIKRH